jgi:hypothetical protein
LRINDSRTKEVVVHKRIPFNAAAFKAVAVIAIGMAVLTGNCRKASYTTILLQNAIDMNRKCPLQIDEWTRLDSTTAGPGKTFTYYYTLVNQTRKRIDAKSMEDRLKPLLINNMKTNRDLEVLRKNGITMCYTYYDKNGQCVLNIRVKPEDYRK